MKKTYLVPSLESIDLSNEQGILNGSNGDPTVNPDSEGEGDQATNKKHGIFDGSESDIWKD